MMDKINMQDKKKVVYKYKSGDWHRLCDQFETHTDFENYYKNHLSELFDEFDPSDMDVLRGIACDLKLEKDAITRLWFGLFKTNFEALTPSVLTKLNERCKKIAALSVEQDKFYQKCQEAYCDQDELDELYVASTKFENKVIECIMNSWIMSSGQPVAKQKPNLTNVQIPDKFDKKMLQYIKVEPWEMPPCPPLIIPERPSVILEVMKVQENSVTAGLDDVFNPLVMAKDLVVDEELFVGDRIIVKGSKWDSITSLIQDPEYDGLAEPACPLSTTDDLLKLEYTFNAKKEQKQLLEKHKEDWESMHWRPLTESQILTISDAESVRDMDDAILKLEQIAESIKQLNESLTKHKSEELFVNDKGEFFARYDNQNELYTYLKSNINNII